MDSKELRIGNYFKYEGYECYREINEISKHCIKYHDSMLMPYCEAPDKPVLVGIPLTEEWLLKFGFVIHNKPYGYTEYIKYKKGTRQYLHKLFTFKESNNDWDGKFGFSGTIQTELNHVHELQNLYHALTKKELTIKK